MTQSIKLKKTGQLPAFAAPDGGAAGASQAGQQEEPSAPIQHYYVFAQDRQIYGPATVQLLQEWTAEGLISRETWVYDEAHDAWRHARHFKDLRAVLPTTVLHPETGCGDISREQLRRVRVFADMDDHQLEEMMHYLGKVQISSLKPVVHKGEHGGSMFLLFSGEATASTRVDGVQKILATLRPGDFFGENTLIETGPRPCDVNTNANCTFLRLRHGDFQKLLARFPDIAARFLTAVLIQLSYMNLTSSTRLSQAKALVRGSLSQTGQIHIPPVVQRRRVS